MKKKQRKKIKKKNKEKINKKTDNTIEELEKIFAPDIERVNKLNKILNSEELLTSKINTALDLCANRSGMPAYSDFLQFVTDLNQQVPKNNTTIPDVDELTTTPTSFLIYEYLRILKKTKKQTVCQTDIFKIKLIKHVFREYGGRLEQFLLNAEKLSELPDGSGLLNALKGENSSLLRGGFFKALDDKDQKSADRILGALDDDEHETGHVGGPGRPRGTSPQRRPARNSGPIRTG